MRFSTTTATLAALSVSLARSQDICAPLDPADAAKVSIKIPADCAYHNTECVEACVTFFDAPNECTSSIDEFEGNHSLSVYDALQMQTFKTGQDVTSVARGWTARFAPGTTSLPAPYPEWPGLEIYGVWDYGLFAFVYDMKPRSPFVPQRIQFAIRFEDEVKAVFVDATC